MGRHPPHPPVAEPIAEPISTVDYYTAGEPFRIVTAGVPALLGKTILEKRRYADEHLDEVRRLLVFEPRGHAEMYGCFATDPQDDQADLGVIFSDGRVTRVRFRKMPAYVDARGVALATPAGTVYVR